MLVAAESFEHALEVAREPGARDAGIERRDPRGGGTLIGGDILVQ